MLYYQNVFNKYYADRQMWAYLFFPLLFIVAKIECKYRVYECSLVRCGTLYIVNVLAVIEQMCRVVLFKCV